MIYAARPSASLAAFLLALASLFSLHPAAVAQSFSIDVDFPGGSGVVSKKDQETGFLRIDPSDHPDRGWRCWWHFRLQGWTPGKSLTLDVGDAPWATPKRATYSIDGGKTWQQSSPGTAKGKRMIYQIPLDSTEALIGWGPPFVPGDAKSLIERLADSCPDATAFNLCTTREGRPTPALRFSTDTKDPPLIWVQARQHAWESGASWVGKGFGEWLASDSPDAVALRQSAEIVFIPVMDIDNVHRGAGGKNQKPQDHNRDWSAQPHWNAVAAAQKEIRAAAESGRLAAFIDLHNPGASDLFPYFYVPPGDIMTQPARDNLARFLGHAKKHITGPLRFTGKTIVSGKTYDPKAWQNISKNWVANLGTPAVSVTLETAWNTPGSTVNGYETVGRQLGKALSEFMRSEP